MSRDPVTATNPARADKSESSAFAGPLCKDAASQDFIAYL
jgi:hypothetical protein